MMMVMSGMGVRDSTTGITVGVGVGVEVGDSGKAVGYGSRAGDFSMARSATEGITFSLRLL